MIDPHLEHREKVQRALAYIAANLGNPLRLADVARVAHLSEFHFHRVFAAVMGETVGDYVTRQRLETAALMLAYHPFRSITEIGYACGYGTPASFSKAFRAYFGCRPRDVRTPNGEVSKIGTLTSKHGKDFAPSDLYALPKALDQSESERRRARLEAALRMEDRAALPLACLVSTNGYDFETVQRTWDELITRARQLGICDDDVDAYGMVHESPQLTAAARCRYYASVPLPSGAPLSPPLFRGEIPAGRYAVFRHSGAVEEIAQTYRDIYAIWFPASSLAPDDFRSIDHYIHGAPQDGVVNMEILIRTRPRPSSV